MSTRGSGGRPRTRLPIVLRRISSVPPPERRPCISQRSSPHSSSASGPSSSVRSCAPLTPDSISSILPSPASGPDPAGPERRERPVGRAAAGHRGDLGEHLLDPSVVELLVVEHPHDEVLGGEGHLIERGQHRHPLEHQRRHRDLPAGVDGADRGVLRQLDPVEEDLVEARRAGDPAQGPDRHPGSVHVDDEHRQAAMLGQARSVRASSRPKSANCAIVVHTFWPPITHPSPPRRALVTIPARSGSRRGLEKS